MYDPLNVYRGRYKDFIESISRERSLSEYFHKHHIIPKCTFLEKNHTYMNSLENLIDLTYEEHFLAHKILAEENPENEKLVRAFWRMANGNLECSPEDYALSRKLFSDSQRGNNYGHLNLGIGKSDISKKRMSKSAIERSKRCPSNLPHDGRVNRGKVKIYCIDDNQERYVKLEESELLISTGHWRLGASPLNRTRMKDSTWRANQSISHIGKVSSIKGRKRINNGITIKYVKEEELSHYLSEGWQLGSLI